MRIFDPKDQLGNSLLSQADAQKSSVKLEKTMAVGDTITLSSADISDIENWELSTARVEANGQMISFLPDTSRDEYGNITIVFGERFENVILVLKRVDFGGVITVEVKIQQLMAKTLVTAGKIGYNANTNITQWKALGEEAYKTDPVKYKAAEITHWDGENPPFELGTTVEESFLSLQTTSPLFVFAGNKVPKKWYSDLPCLQNVDNSPFAVGPIEVFDAKMPNLVDGSKMFANCEHLTTFKSEMPSLTNATSMFEGCEVLNSWTVELPNSLINAKSMFKGCSGLSSWNVALPNSIIKVSYMFRGCSGLESFSTPSGALPDSITDASQMFVDCSGLTSFSPAMPNSLTNASGMFSGCKLDKDSVQNIVDTIPTYTSGSHAITIGYDSTEITQEDEDAFDTTLANKGWTVTWQPN